MGLFVSPLRAASTARKRFEHGGGSPVAPRASAHAADGRVIEVRRASRELTVRTSGGTIEHVVVPAAVRGPRGTSELGDIRAGMSVRAEGEMDHERLIARTISAR